MCYIHSYMGIPQLCVINHMGWLDLYYNYSTSYLGTQVHLSPGGSKIKVVSSVGSRACLYSQVDSNVQSTPQHPKHAAAIGHSHAVEAQHGHGHSRLLLNSCNGYSHLKLSCKIDRLIYNSNMMCKYINIKNSALYRHNKASYLIVHMLYSNIFMQCQIT